MNKARALYDFNGEANTAELSITSGEVLTVTRKDVGEGWWEGCNSQGQTGLFPAAYVEEIPSGPPAMPPPMLPVKANDDWGDPNQTPSEQDVDGWDDDWDEEEVYSTIPGNQESQQIYANDSNYPAPMPVTSRHDDPETASMAGNESNKGTVSKKTLNRFSSFVKSGGESYILGTLKIQVSDADKVIIRHIDERYFWDPIKIPYSVSVASPKKESKLKGLKSYIAYQLTPSFNNLQVSRRYKHFDWLHERLAEKYCLISIPPLPDKQISNRYDDTFIEQRKIQLQEFVDWVCKHPVLSISPVWQHFLTCTDEKRWKVGKRSAEKDPLVGANFCATIIAPEKNLQMSFIEGQMDTTISFIQKLEVAVKDLLTTVQDQSKKHTLQYKREYEKIGNSLAVFAAALEYDENKNPSKLTNAIKFTGVTYVNISKLYGDQPKLDWIPLGAKLHLLKGLTTNFPEIINLNRGALLKRKECERLTAEKKMENVQLLEVQQRVEVVNYAVLAEIRHFKTERAVDLENTMKKFINEQITFYENIVKELQKALTAYDD